MTGFEELYYAEDLLVSALKFMVDNEDYRDDFITELANDYGMYPKYLENC